MSRSHGYGSETRSMGTGTSFRIRIPMGTGMGKGILQVYLSPLKNLATGLTMKEGFVESVFRCYRYTYNSAYQINWC